MPIKTRILLLSGVIRMLGLAEFSNKSKNAVPVINKYQVIYLFYLKIYLLLCSIIMIKIFIYHDN